MLYSISKPKDAIVIEEVENKITAKNSERR